MPVVSTDLGFRLRAKTNPWSAYEDQRLIAALHHLGSSDWYAIACFVGNNRTKAQCYQRWTRGLDPNISKQKWTSEDDAQLMMYISIYGEKAWSKISAEMGNRCDVQCRYRYKQLLKESNFAEMNEQAKEAAKKMAKSIPPTVKPKPPLLPRCPHDPQPPLQVMQLMPCPVYPQLGPPPNCIPFPVQFLPYPQPPQLHMLAPSSVPMVMPSVGVVGQSASGVIVYRREPVAQGNLRAAQSAPSLPRKK
jgi:hypothetical protein